MAWDLMHRAGVDVLAHLGESVTTDEGPVTALVDSGNAPATLRRQGGSNATDHGLPTDLHSMQLIVRERDADLLPPGTGVAVRGTDYEVVEIQPHGFGLVAVPLMPAQPEEAAGAVWR